MTARLRSQPGTPRHAAPARAWPAPEVFVRPATWTVRIVPSHGLRHEQGFAHSLRLPSTAACCTLPAVTPKAMGKSTDTVTTAPLYRPGWTRTAGLRLPLVPGSGNGASNAKTGGRQPGRCCKRSNPPFSLHPRRRGLFCGWVHGRLSMTSSGARTILPLGSTRDRPSARASGASSGDRPQ